MTTDPEARGWSPRWIAALMMALSGLFFFLALLMQDMRALDSLNRETVPIGLMLRYAVAMALGGALAGYLTSALFGRGAFGGLLRSFGGYLLAIVAGIVASIFAGAFGAAFGEVPELLRDGYHTRDLVPIAGGAVILAFVAAGRPVLLLVWFGIVIATHVWTRKARRARFIPG
ncbi:hypothetical protein R5H30_11190 [Sulfitobacter sp. D35]|uniref:hypothetical protein n=1 Tax=Sulfitobacter sp. D35 TaxID=3083252 RepID=UPI00296F7412|nr:hypothetical protein [Sulfitobacter sp. D35]MDW4498548.1 hypothetical protein [Sulfitobacter sp. D35]